MTVEFSGTHGLSIIVCGDTTKIVDDDLNVYDSWDVFDPFVDLNETICRFVKKTLDYFKDIPWPQFRTLALKQFANYAKKLKKDIDNDSKSC